MENIIKLQQPQSISRSFIAVIVMIALFMAAKQSIGLPIPAIFLILFGMIYIFFTGINEPERVIIAFAIFIPFSKVMPGNIATGINTLNLLDILLIFTFFFHCHFTGKKLYQYNVLDIPLFTFWMIGLFQVIRGDIFLKGTGGLDVFIEYKRWSDAMLMYWITFNVIQDRKNIRRVLFVVMLMTVIVALMTIKDFMDVGSVSSIEKMRIGGIAKQPNALGAFFAYYGHLITGIFIFFRPYRWKAWLFPIPILMILRGLQFLYCISES